MNELQAMLARNQPENQPYTADGQFQLTPAEKDHFMRMAVRQAYAEGGEVKKEKKTSALGALENKEFWRNVLSNAGDLAQSASNAVAGNVAGPVDLISMGLAKLGLDVKDPVMGSEWLKRRGLMRDVPDGLPNIAGETLGLLAPTAVTAGAPKIAGALNKMSDNAMAAKTLNPETGAIVWHGSPHRFDKFDSSKIGAGEGAQSYGYGLYLAENPKVADEYASKLSKLVIDFLRKSPSDATELAIKNKLLSLAETTQTGSKLDEINKVFDSYLSPKTTKWNPKHPQANSYNGMAPLDADELERVVALRDAANRLGRPELSDTGSLYKVDLPDDQIAKMLDWDKPLGQQHPDVQAVFSQTPLPSETTGQKAYEWLQQIGGGTKEEASKFAARYLSEKDIPGIRYFDGGSRGAGEGTSNFVVFPGNEDLLTILERNSKPVQKFAEGGPVWGGADQGWLNPDGSAYVEQKTVKAPSKDTLSKWTLNASDVDKILGDGNAWRYTDGGQTADLTMGSGQKWNPSGASSGITLHRKGDPIYDMAGTGVGAGNDPSKMSYWTRSDGESGGNTPPILGYYDQDTYDVSGDLSALNNKPGSNIHANVQYVRQGDKLVPVTDPNIWDWQKNNLSSNMDLVNSAIVALGGYYGGSALAGAEGAASAGAMTVPTAAESAAAGDIFAQSLAPYAVGGAEGGGALSALSGTGTGSAAGGAELPSFTSAGSSGAATGYAGEPIYATQMGAGGASVLPAAGAESTLPTFAGGAGGASAAALPTFTTGAGAAGTGALGSLSSLLTAGNILRYAPGIVAGISAAAGGNKTPTGPGGATPNPDQRSLNQWDWDAIRAAAKEAGMPVSEFMAKHWDKVSTGNYNKGEVNLAAGGALNRLASGGGSGRDDTIDAKLSDGEYVFDAETVSMLGDGSTKAGAERLDHMRSMLRKHKGANLAKGKFSANAKTPMAYLKEST